MCRGHEVATRFLNNDEVLARETQHAGNYVEVELVLNTSTQGCAAWGNQAISFETILEQSNRTMLKWILQKSYGTYEPTEAEEVSDDNTKVVAISLLPLSPAQDGAAS